VNCRGLAIISLATLLVLQAGAPLNCFVAPHEKPKFHKESFAFEGKTVAYDTSDPGGDAPVILLLHGASGPSLPVYGEQAEFFADHGFTTVEPHYFDATKSSQPTPENYRAWVRLVDAMVKQMRAASTTGTRRVFLVGYSLGASVALAAGSQGVPVDAIAEWYGSLPDDFFYAFKGMPPLLVLHGQQDNNIPVGNATQLLKLCAMKHLVCESHIYADQGHGFAGYALSDADARTIEFLSRYPQPR